MTLKTISEKAKSFTFTHSFADCQTVIELTYKGKGQLVAEYVEDKKLNYIFKRICESFKDCKQVER